jgi:CDP-glucose 4,6-dehydratase
VLGLRQAVHHVNLDLRDAQGLQDHVKGLRPDVIFHLAAQALVRRSYRQPLLTLETNFLGTANLLEAVRQAGYSGDRPCVFIAVTSDKCYENKETYFAYREDDPMGGHDLYSMSKGAMELLVSSWRRSFFHPNELATHGVHLASVRAGNVIGGGDQAEDRIVVDCIRALASGKPIEVRNPLAIRPWQHVLEPLSGYMWLAACLGKDGPTSQELLSAWNFGPGDSAERTVGELADEIIRNWGQGSWYKPEGAHAVHEARFLKLAIEKSRHFLRWQPVWRFEEAVANTVGWYRQAHACGFDGARMAALTAQQLEGYCQDGKARGVAWAQ